jgi:hypothetical protein
VTWEDRDRLLLAPLGKVLLCAAFPEKGTLKRPTFQQPRKVRTAPRKENAQKKESSRKKQKQKSRQRPRPYFATRTTSKSSKGPCDGLHPRGCSAEYNNSAAATARTAANALQPSSCYGVHARRAAPDDIALRFQVEQHAYMQAPREGLGAHREQLVHRRMGTDTTGCMADSSNLNSDERDVPEMFKCINFDGYGDWYDSAS